jgi:hypothetical protein
MKIFPKFKTSRDIFNMNCPKNEAGNSRNSERNTLEGNADCLLDGRTNAIGCSTFVFAGVRRVECFDHEYLSVI